MQILSIGNSFSQDAQRYLHGIAEADGVNLVSFNNFIGGCTLYTHFRNMMSDERAYTLEMNGFSTGFRVSIKEALLNREWDVVTLQQASHVSTKYSTYQPYIGELAECVRKFAPKAKVVIHQTWAYEAGSARLTDTMGYADQADMYNDLKAAYDKAYSDIGADMLIPSGTLFQSLLAAGIGKIHRDSFHASLGVGRYALGLLWYAMLTGRDVNTNTFSGFSEKVSEENVALIKKCVSDIALK